MPRRRHSLRGAGTIINIASIVGIVPELLNGVYGATKAYVLAFSHSLQHEPGDKGIRIQVVLPGATATDFWEKTGLPYQNLPESIVMSAEDMVDAARSGSTRANWLRFPASTMETTGPRSRPARREMSKKFGNSVPCAPIRDWCTRVGLILPRSKLTSHMNEKRREFRELPRVHRMRSGTAQPPVR